MLVCKAIYDKGNIDFVSDHITDTELGDIIEDDKRYGKMVPKNGDYFTVRIADWEDKLISKKQIKKAVTLAWQQCEIEIPLDVKIAKEGQYADFKVYFRKTADDPELTGNTLMYHYYPISDFDEPRRGVCVVNTDWNWSTHGEPISMHEIDPAHYPPDTTAKGETIDFDGVYTHEGPGHGLGLPHVKIPYNLMYPSYSYMVEVVSLESPHITIPRWTAKYGERQMISRWRARWRAWYKARSDRY